MLVDVAITPVAGRQCGLFDRDQWFDVGGDDYQLLRRVRNGRLTDEGIGVYGLPGWPSSFLRDLWRAHLIAGRHSVVSNESAAQLHVLWPFPRGRLVLSVPHGGHHRPTTATIRQPRDLRPQHIVLVHGIPATSIPRTFCDLAATSTRPRLVRGLEKAHLDGKAKISETIEVYEELRRPGKPGFKMLGEVLEVRHPDFFIPPSELEKMFKRLLHRFSLPEPVWQPSLPWDPSRRADGLWPEQRVFLELDSRSWHARTDQMTADRRRDRDARRNGFDLLRLTYEEVKYEARRAIGDVREALALTA